MKLLNPLRRGRRKGSALVLVLIFGATLISLAALSLDSARTETLRYRQENELFQARQAANAGLNEALALLRDGGISRPMSGDSGADNHGDAWDDAPDGFDDPEWVQHGPSGGYFYRTTRDFTGGTEIFTITCWGRFQSGTGAQFQQNVHPENPAYDSDGWTQRAVEVLVIARQGIPEAPLYFGNGGVEKGRGGWQWDADADPFDPSTWSYLPVNGNSNSVSSYISRGLVGNGFSVDSRAHPEGWLDMSASERANVTLGVNLDENGNHAYGIFASQTLVGAHNASSFFDSWDGGDPNPHLSPAPEGSDFGNDRSNAFPVDTSIPDVQTWSWQLWSEYGNDPNSVHIDDNDSNLSSLDGQNGVVRTNGGISPGGRVYTVGGPNDPRIVFTTGTLRVGSNNTLKGYGILVVRDDYHPDTGGNNEPNVDGNLQVDGRLEWSGLVILSGWHPFLSTKTSSNGAGIYINGALFGEDSVQSGGETALDTAQIQSYLGNSKNANNENQEFRVTYSREIFEPGGLVYDLLPRVQKQVVAIYDLE